MTGVQTCALPICGDALLAPSVTRALIAAFTAGGAHADTQPSLPGGAARSSGADRQPPGGQSRARPGAAPHPGLGSLTEREREVVGLVAAGLSNDEIAGQLVVSPLTAKTHVSRAMIKLDARDRAQLVVIAYEHGLAEPGGR